MPAHDNFTALLEQAASGSEEASARLVPLIYEELRGMARGILSREPSGVSFETTALVHEAWLKLAGPDEGNWENRRHYFGAAARSMRRILVDHARRRQSGARVELDVENLEAPSGLTWDAVVGLDRALAALEREDERKGLVVTMRYFGGLSVEETARALDIAPRTVKREWRFARAWIVSRMQRDAEETS